MSQSKVDKKIRQCIRKENAKIIWHVDLFPKPKLLPSFIYLWLIHKVLRIRYVKEGGNGESQT